MEETLTKNRRFALQLAYAWAPTSGALDVRAEKVVTVARIFENFLNNG